MQRGQTDLFTPAVAIGLLTFFITNFLKGGLSGFAGFLLGFALGFICLLLVEFAFVISSQIRRVDAKLNRIAREGALSREDSSK